MQTRRTVHADLMEGTEGRRYRNRNLDLNTTMPCQTSRHSNISDRSKKPAQESLDGNPRKRWSHHSISSTSLADICKTEGLVPLSPNTLQLKQSQANTAGCRFNPNLRAIPPSKATARISRAECGYVPENYEERSPSHRIDPSIQSLLQFKIKRMHTPPKDNFSSLPDEMVLRVFKWLPKQSLGRVAQTCKRLKRLAEDETLWRRVDVQGKFLYPGHLGVLMSRNPWYLRLARAEVKEPTGIPRGFAASQLRYLDLSMCVINSDTLTNLLGMCTSLVKLSLEQLSVPKKTIAAMQVFASTIDCLNLTMCSDLDAEGLALFLSKAKELKQLNLGCIVSDWSSADLLKVLCCLSERTEQLNLAGFRHLLADSHVEIVAQRCRRIVDLDISDSQEVSMASMEAISSYLDKLQHLALNRCYGINMLGYGLLANLKSLRYLDIHTHLRTETVREISALVPKVEINNFIFSSVARPTVGAKRSSIWNERVRD